MNENGNNVKKLMFCLARESHFFQQDMGHQSKQHGTFFPGDHWNILQEMEDGIRHAEVLDGVLDFTILHEKETITR